MGDITIIAIVACIGITITHMLNSRTQKGMQRVIDRQQDTIQRLINREPVTYQEVGANPKKPNKEIYAAWGSQVVNIDEDESRQ